MQRSIEPNRGEQPGGGGGESPGGQQPGIAVIVPTLRDTEAVRVLLDAAARWSPSAGNLLIVAGEPDGALAQLCEQHNARLLTAPPNRGAQLDAGARAADASVLWFLHADTAVPTDAPAAIGRALAAGADSGCFTFSFQGHRTWYKAVIAWLVNLRVRAGGIAYGDQALFMTREAYVACGGFPHQPLFEEVPLVRCLRRRGRFHVLPERVAVSPRRWERDGWLRRTLHNRWLALRYALGVPADRLAQAYASSDRGRGRRPST